MRILIWRIMMKMKEINPAIQAIKNINELEDISEDEKAMMRAHYEPILQNIDNDGNTLLMQIALYGESEKKNDIGLTTWELIQTGADITATNNAGHNVLEITPVRRY
jgi:hypothetical protein